jgi:hypothetical protein
MGSEEIYIEAGGRHATETKILELMGPWYIGEFSRPNVYNDSAPLHFNFGVSISALANIGTMNDRLPRSTRSQVQRYP